MTSNMINKLLIRRITSRRTGYYSCRSSSLLQSPLSSMKISVEVRNALVDHKPIVALESTLITHGMPYPQNLQTGRQLEHIVRSNGAVPATIALIDGDICVGVSDEQLQLLADCRQRAPVKISRRDLPSALVDKSIGGTTVAASIYIAHLAGIRVFATGGIGGVHRGANETFDISADLIEIARTPVAVVCAGIKSILDIAKTLEYLETHSVPVIVYADSNIFPGFFTPTTNSRAPYNTMSIDKIVDIINKSHQLKLTAGCLIACPIAHDQYTTVGCEIETAITTALHETIANNISGQAITPFLLARVNQLTGGKSLTANIKLLENNAKIASQIAVAYSKVTNKSTIVASEKIRSIATSSSKSIQPLVLCIGATTVDFEVRTEQIVQTDGGTYEGTIRQTCGGVARNHADALHRCGIDSRLLSVIGCDEHAKYVRRYCQHMNFDLVHAISGGVSTATYMALNERGNLRYGIGAIDRIMTYINPQMIIDAEETIAIADFILIDANISVESIRTIIELANIHKRNVWFEPTDLNKITQLFDAKCFNSIHILSPNANEFVTICRQLRLPSLTDEMLTNMDAMAEYVQTNAQSFAHLHMLIVTLGAYGAVIAQNVNNPQITTLHPMHIDNAKIKSVSGAGDCFNSGLLAYRLLHNVDWTDCIHFANECASASLQSFDAVPSTIENIRQGPVLMNHFTVKN